MKPKKIAIIGLGLMGASLALALRKKFRSTRIIGVSRHPQTIKEAQKRKMIDAGFMDVARAVSNADIVFVCTPVDTIPNYLREINHSAKPGTIVTDVGSVKSEIVLWADRAKFQNIHFVGSHPLAGSHRRGIESAAPNLYEGASVFVTPSKKTDRSASRIIIDLWKKIGCRPVVLSPQQHDKVMSSVSHLPHAIASVLVHTIPVKNFKHCGPGFLDTTRVAQGDPRLWEPIFGFNRKNLIGDLKNFERNLAKFICLLERGNSQKLIQSLYKSSSLRSKL